MGWEEHENPSTERLDVMTPHDLNRLFDPQQPDFANALTRFSQDLVRQESPNPSPSVLVFMNRMVNHEATMEGAAWDEALRSMAWRMPELGWDQDDSDVQLLCRLAEAFRRGMLDVPEKQFGPYTARWVMGRHDRHSQIAPDHEIHDDPLTPTPIQTDFYRKPFIRPETLGVVETGSLIWKLILQKYATQPHHLMLVPYYANLIQGELSDWSSLDQPLPQVPDWPQISEMSSLIEQARGSFIAFMNGRGAGASFDRGHWQTIPNGHQLLIDQLPSCVEDEDSPLAYWRGTPAEIWTRFEQMRAYNQIREGRPLTFNLALFQGQERDIEAVLFPEFVHDRRSSRSGLSAVAAIEKILGQFVVSRRHGVDPEHLTEAELRAHLMHARVDPAIMREIASLNVLGVT